MSQLFFRIFFLCLVYKHLGANRIFYLFSQETHTFGLALQTYLMKHAGFGKATAKSLAISGFITMSPMGAHMKIA
jgi:hypothetical protein